MDRPLSAASSGVAPSASTHKRNASVKTTSKPSGPSVLDLFVTNLRFLNCDRLPGWPNITAASFGIHDARTKIKCAEYALYQLFRIYDPHTTTEKLQPFFPPLEPLQSVNLRAALYRCLNDLKKNGVLPKDAVLRKSMLDECQGDKFWEVCLAFSALVLRKVTLERKTRHGRPVAEQIGTAPNAGKRARESMLPLAFAHTAALKKVLDERRRKKETYIKLHDLFVQKSAEMKQRGSQSGDNARKVKTLSADKLRSLESAIGKGWVGSTELKGALIEGDTCGRGDGILVESFDHLWQQAGEQGLTVSSGADVGLLQDLNSRATQQSVRLRMWQNYLNRVVAARPEPRPPTGNSESAGPALRFDKHRGITRHEVVSEDDEGRRETKCKPTPRPQQTRHATAFRYDEILTAMREDLRKSSGNRSSDQSTISPPKRAHPHPMPVRPSSLLLDAAAGAQNSHSRSPSMTAVPMRPRMGRRVSSQSKAYEKPKVDSQREPIPLKSELFSPLKENRRSVSSTMSFSPVLPSAAEGTDDGDAERGAAVIGKASRAQLKDDADSGVDLQSSRDDVVTDDNDANSSRSSVSLDNDAVSVPPADAIYRNPAIDALRPSLAERTRRSIAYNSEDFASTLPRGQPANDHGTTQREPANFAQTQNTLLDRTRESISAAPTPLDLPKKASHIASRSSQYPAKQFDTPHKSGNRDFTPMEQLMSPEAEYESVFRSRPRIALSPILSPRDDEDGELETRSLDVDGGGSSPLGFVSSRR
ncbi:HAUS augmin-like complex subunit 6 N-terminus-domain-containing protein [Neohortaea acidophila]|uniref:HAUS augmin-like complex subunit 6 N-terminus-domain-containing protein n=1 Tax=Neohortaea acidophila TaxID=245834 RepID=A0A6A6Q0K9_9PEZI|nr:HAUS augmin-like complex subunit 6 N-terminus-domain-containing protein [Neohortaea acidophila]KAF2485223.1 HAUS augmin-like complex subunit 6 N-terminus-domain-containing protein [Neohortaea acidophila]